MSAVSPSAVDRAVAGENLAPTDPLLSILVPTLESRRASFERLWAELRRQIDAAALGQTVEVVFLRDGGDESTGRKRNVLVERATGEYVAFVDDDDRVHPAYVPLVVDALRLNPGVDCLGIRGEIQFLRGERRTFVYSLRYADYHARGGMYLRPPHHLNPMRRAIARRYPFEDVTRHEDADVALRMARDGALKKEHFVDETLYFYDSRRSYRYQRLLDLTEPVRHRLGIRVVNSLRLKRWVRSLRLLRPGAA